MKTQDKKIQWYVLAFMSFSTVWGFGNVLNGFIYFNGTQVMLSWILMFALYFIPYALMVGELGSAFKNSGSGVNSWIYETTGPKIAYYAGWTYWACHITYIASKGSGGLKALSWAIFRDHETYDTIPTVYVQLATLAVFLICCYIASRGLNPLKKLTTIAGTSMFVMSLLYIVMMFAAPAINPGADFISLDFSLDNLIPNFNMGYFTSLSILVFAVGGCEKISPYVNKVKDPSKGFPKGIIFMAVMVAGCAILGTIAMGMMFDPAVINESQETFDSYAANGAYWAFQRLGEFEAPKYITWSHQNSRPLITVPLSEDSTAHRFKLRAFDGCINPYIVFALLIHAGLDGIEQGLPLPPACDENLFTASDEVRARYETLPGALCDAIRIAKDSDFITKYLPEKARTAFFAAKQAEHDRIVLADDRTAAERSLYFERY